MAKYVNKEQLDLMLNKMQNNRPIACGFGKLPKEAVTEFWKSLTEQLNAAGPPIKNVTEWKKVWTDQKRYVRSKAAANMKNQRATGGGPNQNKSFTASEQCIFELVGMKESVEGLENTRKFGEPNGYGICEVLEMPRTPLYDCESIAVVSEIAVVSDVPSCSKQVTPPPECQSGQSNEKKACSFKRRRLEYHEKLTTADLIAKEVSMQEKLCSKICEIGELMQNANREMGSAVKRMYRALEKSNELKSKEIKMLEKHHEEVKQLRAKKLESKIEKNNKLIHIEERKLKILERNSSRQ